MFPPIPPFNAIHPIVVHFPIALLMVVPLIIVCGLLCAPHRRGFIASALVLMLVGTSSLYLAMESGEAGEDALTLTEAQEDLIEEHEESAETTQVWFVALTVVLFLLVVVPPVLGRELKGGSLFVPYLVFLLAYGGGALSLMNTGHLGGMLVHKHGLRAPMGEPADAVGAKPAEPVAKADDD